MNDQVRWRIEIDFHRADGIPSSVETVDLLHLWLRELKTVASHVDFDKKCVWAVAFADLSSDMAKEAHHKLEVLAFDSGLIFTKIVTNWESMVGSEELTFGEEVDHVPFVG